MFRQKTSFKGKAWKIEYVRRLFKFGFRCQSCGVKTREWVNHIIIDYCDKNGKPRLIPLRSSWHHSCHDRHCRHDFCVAERQARQFGNYMTGVVRALGNMVKTADVPEFLSRPHRELNGLSPLQMIWHHDDWGYERVLAVIENVASGTFV